MTTETLYAVYAAYSSTAARIRAPTIKTHFGSFFFASGGGAGGVRAALLPAVPAAACALFGSVTSACFPAPYGVSLFVGTAGAAG